MTIYSCVGSPNVLESPLFMIGTKTEGKQFVDFLKFIMEQRKDKYDNRKIVLFLDQATAHWGNNVG